VFSFKHYFTSELFAAVHEAGSNPDKSILNKTITLASNKISEHRKCL
jgi:hypothetical protein